MNLKKTLIFAFLAFISILSVKSQVKNEQEKEVFKYIEDNDLFSLIELYPSFKDSLNTAVQKFTEALLYKSIGNSQASIYYIDEFLKEQHLVDDVTKVEALLMLADNLMQEQKYDDAANVMKYIIEVTTPFSDEKSLKELEIVYDEMLKYNGLPKRYHTRPEKDAELDFEYKKVGRGELISVPCKINGNARKAVFDTGCNVTNMSLSFALENNIRIINKALSLYGTGGTSEGTFGVADSIQVGDITYYNVVCAIRLSPTPLDSVADLLLGLELMMDAGEIIIMPKEKKIIIPIHNSPLPSTGLNMLFVHKTPLVKVYSGSERLIFLFDSGSVGMEMHESYYRKHRERIEKEGLKTEISIGGIGGVSQQEVYNLPHFKLCIGKKNIDVNNMFVLTAKDAHDIKNVDGSLGVSFIKACDRITVNFRRSFIAID